MFNESSEIIQGFSLILLKIRAIMKLDQILIKNKYMRILGFIQNKKTRWNKLSVEVNKKNDQPCLMLIADEN